MFTGTWVFVQERMDEIKHNFKLLENMRGQNVKKLSAFQQGIQVHKTESSRMTGTLLR